MVLPDPGGPIIVAAGAGNLEGALGGLLPADIFEVNGKILRFAEHCLLIDFERQNSIPGVYEMNDIE
jgi:hypothetical protein